MKRSLLGRGSISQMKLSLNLADDIVLVAYSGQKLLSSVQKYLEMVISG